MWRRLALSGRRIGTLAGLLGLCLFLWILTPHFLTVSNLLNVLEQTSINAVIAVGMTFVILSAGIDLSVGSLLALSGVVMATLLHGGWRASDRDRGGPRDRLRLRRAERRWPSRGDACRRSSPRSA